MSQRYICDKSRLTRQLGCGAALRAEQRVASAACPGVTPLFDVSGGDDVNARAADVCQHHVADADRGLYGKGS